MIKKIKLSLSLLLISIISLSLKAQTDTSHLNYVVVLSMDAFRWDYTNMTSTPTLDSITQVGVKASSLKPTFPSLTFPNHYSLATGLYPDNHGIVSNNFYDKTMDATYSIGNRKAVENGAFYDGEPIWVTAEKQGIKTASYYWVGSEAPIQGIQPAYWKKYDESIPFEDRIDTVIFWLQKPIDTRPRLIMCYFDEPDAIAHKYSPGSSEVNNMVSYLDSLVGVFIKKLNTLPHRSKIDFIIVSDHGMAPTSSERLIDLSKYLKKEWVSHSQGGNPITLIEAATNCSDSILQSLSANENLRAWKTSEIPSRLNYGKNPRTLDIVILANNTWSLSWGPKKSSYTGGAHGYDNDEMDMHGIFFAVGPHFKAGYLHKQIEGVDLYPLLAKLLNLVPAPTDGKLSNTIELLK